MKVSKGNRGGKGRQWGERAYAPEKKEKLKKARYTGTTTVRMELEWRYKNGEEMVYYMTVCDNCGARGACNKQIDWRTKEFTGGHVCVCCGLDVTNAERPN